MIFDLNKIKIKYILTGLMTIFIQYGFSQDCEKCDTGKLLDLSENMENLDYKTVKNFVCTFDSTCKNNIEFSEWSNELLFDLIKQDVNLLNHVLHDLGYKYVKLIAKELETPVVEVDLKRIYNLVKNADGPKDMIEEEKKAIKKAAENEGLNFD